MKQQNPWQAGGKEGCTGRRPREEATPHWHDDRDEVRVAAEPCWEAGGGGREMQCFLAGAVSAHQQHCSSFICLYSWLLSAPHTEDENVFSERSSLPVSLSAQANGTGHRNPHVSSRHRCTQALSSSAKAIPGLGERLKWSIQQITFANSKAQAALCF